MQLLVLKVLKLVILSLILKTQKVLKTIDIDEPTVCCLQLMILLSLERG
jgi:hypothetical protein